MLTNPTTRQIRISVAWSTAKWNRFWRKECFLAKQSGVDIIPIGLSGLFRLKSKRSWIIQPTAVTVRFGPPVSKETIQALSEEELMERVRGEIGKLIEGT